MKRIIQACLLFLSLFLFQRVNAQVFTFTATPLNICYDGINPVIGGAAVTSTGAAGTNSFDFVVTAPAGCPAATFTVDPTSVDGSSISITYDCCGTYQIDCTPYASGIPVGTTVSRFPVVTCVNSVTVTTAPTNSYVCPGASATLDATPAGNTYTWYPSGAVGSQLIVFPNAGVCYTVVGTTPSACTVTAVSCLSVQITTVTVSPASQTLCSGNTTTLFATASSNTTGIQWFGPGPVPLNPGNALSQTITPVGPTGSVLVYTAGIASFGPAGNCTASASASVTIGTSIPMTLTASSASVCPNEIFTLTANPVSATSYSFSQLPAGGFTAVTASNTYTVTGPGIYTVNADYNGCPGSAGVAVSSATLTPTLTVSSTLTCPGRPIDFTVTSVPNATYTYYYVPVGGGPITNFGSNTTGIITHTPPAVPAGYSVGVAGPGGCTGAATVTINSATAHPRFSATTPSSVCPNSTFTITEEGGMTYTLTAPTGATVNPTSANTATSIISAPSFPATYTLATDSLGCRASSVVTIQKLELKRILIASSYSVCPGSVFTLTAANTASNTIANTSYTFESVPVDPNIPVGAVSAHSATSSIPSGSFPVTYTLSADSSGCIGTASLVINLLSLNNNINLSINTNGIASPSVCPGSQFTLVATNGSSPNGLTSYSYAASNTVTPLSPKNETVTSSVASGSFPYTYTISADSAGCVGTKTFTVYQLFIHPTLSISPTGSVCAGSQVTITASSTSTDPLIPPTQYTFAYSPPATPNPLGTPSQTNNFVVHNPTVNTTYYVLADSSGCTTPILSAGTITVGILPDLPLTLTTTSAQVCSGNTATLSVNNVTTYTYTWFASTNTNVSIPTTPPDTSIVVNPTVNTTYSVHAVDPGGCVGNAAITISVNPTYSLNISAIPSPTAVCPGGSITITASGALSYTWFPTTGLNTANSAVVVSTPSTSIIYTVTGDNTLGCYGAATVVANVVAVPDLTIAPTASAVCVGYTSTLTAFGAVTYTWVGSNITPVYQQAIAVTPGSYTVYGSNGGGCIDSTDITIGLAPDLVITTSQSSYTTCIANNSPKYSKPVTLTASGGSSYSWLPYNPSTVTYSLGPSTTVIPPASTCYTVTGYTSVCSGSAVVCVTVVPQFTMNVVPPLPAMCTGDSLKLSIVNISTLAVGPISAFTYSWTEPQNAVLSLSNPLTPTVIAFPQSTATYSVEMRDSRSCVSIPRLVTVTVYPRPLTAVSIPTINGVPTNTICFVGTDPGEEGNLLTLTASNQNAGLPFGVVPTYTWVSPPEYTSTSILTAPNNNFVTVKAPVRTPSVVVYSVYSGYNGIPGCSRLDTVSVRVIDCRPIRQNKIQFITDRPNDTICTRQCVTFTSLTDTAAGGPQKLYWTFAGGAPATSTLQFPTVCYNLPTDKDHQFNVVLRVENPYPKSAGGSSASKGVFGFVTVVDVPNVEVVAPGGVSSDTTVRFGQSVSLNGSGALSYQWSPLYNISSSTDPNVIVHPFQTTQYILTGYNSKGCFSSDTVNVVIIPDCGEMYVPNAFSPNGDGSNDILYVRGICLESLTFMVFNRWGEKVFETIDQKVGWNGSYRGEDANSGVYVYRLEGKTYDGKGYSSKGNVTLIR